jgi:hypothetical protein
MTVLDVLKSQRTSQRMLILCQLYDNNHWFFDENLKFFEVAEITGTNNSLILNFFERTGIGDSLILKYLKNRN